MKRLALIFVVCISLFCGYAPLTSAAPAIISVSEEKTVASAEKAIPYKREEVSTGESAGRAGIILVVLLSVGVGGLYIVKRYFPQLYTNMPLPVKAKARRRMEMIETMRLNSKISLYLLQVDGRPLVLAQSGDRITVVDAAVLAKGCDDRKESVHHA